MKEILSKVIFIFVDIAAIVLSLILAYQLRNLIDFFDILDITHTIDVLNYLNFWPIYTITIAILAYEGIYTHRYDFWHESRLIFKGLFFSLIIVLAYLALTKSVQNYSRIVIVLSFILMAFLIPFLKIITKTLLYRIRIWQKPVKVYANDEFLKKELFSNPYLGYVPANKKEPKTVFINSSNGTINKLSHLIDSELQNRHEVNFIPLMNDYDLTQSHIYSLFNTRTNLIVFQNRLKSKYRQLLQCLFNYTLAIILLPILLPIIGIIAILVKKESPGPVFFVHTRVGKNSKSIPTLKFRSMYVDADKRLEKLLKENPEIKDEWEKNFKLKNDPRVTKIGAFLRKTSLDELPQIFNILRGDMYFVGPRPVIQKEIEQYYKENAVYYYMVKPGITGLWQVSGRSDTDYDFRVKIDKWYVINWSIWLDIIILFKTVKVVLKREGAY
ncbi:undecaprenyl-phosphate galactosephosphotransferase [Hydrogenimonas sp.]|nr:undecaprenyl-phosphate galactosephosphotransferase [Hydrogenimonas sp.]